MLIETLFVFGHILTIVKSQNIGNGVSLIDYANTTGAVCLDGSPGLYYIGKGTGDGINKFLIYFQGGGWCSGVNVSSGIGFDSCSHRRTTSLGSTKGDSKTKNLEGTFGMSINETLNPTMYNWNHIYVEYCDGGSFSGNRKDAIIGNEGPLYFRGKRILDAVLDSLNKHNNLNSATDIVISGGSAGGLATFLHTNYIANKYPNKKIVSLPNVGFFIEYNGYDASKPTNYANGLEWIYNNMNVSSSILDNDCKLNDECIFAQNLAGGNIVPTFIFNSQYDSWQTENILGSTNAELINEYGKNFTNILISNYLSKNNDNGKGMYAAYINSCHYHDGDSNHYWYGLSIDGFSPVQAFNQFYNEIGNTQKQLFWYQNVTYPCNNCCP
eukprot:382200_1